MHSASSDSDLPARELLSHAHRTETLGQFGASKLIAVLDSNLAIGAAAPDSIFRAATDAAKALTDADGVAVALRAGNAVVCRARSGGIAPELGSTLDTSSGISGICLRTAEVQQCDDAQIDSRVDPDVCRQLGVRSLVAVPILGSGGAIGILEAFSVRPYAFGFEQIQVLARLGGIIAAAHAGEFSASDPALGALTSSSPTTLPSLAASAPVLSERVHLFLPQASGRPTLETVPEAAVGKEQFAAKEPSIQISTRSRQRFWIPLAVGALLLATGGVVWMNWSDTDREVNSAAQLQGISRGAQRREATAISAPISAPKPDAAVTAAHSDGLSANRVLRNAAELRREPVETGDASPVLKLPPATHSTPPSQTNSAESNAKVEPPAITVEAGNSEEQLRGLVSVTPDVPTFSAPVSAGVTLPTLIHRVIPVYPAQARTQKVEGSVVLSVVVGEDGMPRDIQVADGPNLLVQPALEAIRQWRFRPALLDGKVVPMVERITVHFRAPAK